MILNASAENGSESSGGRTTWSSSLKGRWPSTGGTSTGLRQVVHDRVEQRLDALVLERRAAEHRDALAREGGAADRAAELLDGGLLLVDELLHELLVVVGELLEQLVVGGLGRGLVLVGDVGVLPVLAHLAFPVVGLHLDEVDDAVELGLGAPGELQDERVGGQAVDDHRRPCARSRRRCGPSC